ncbi:MAG: DUF1460 domain-containing protein [Muribaculaceae bacterium]|nr:DUF1460 domain-containing protein [Muribaculaceae bacterium]
MNRIVSLLAAILIFSASASAQTEVRFHSEASDTLLITKLLGSAAEQRFADSEARVAFFARQFEGTPYGAGTLEADTEILTVNLDSLDCTTFVETAMALAYTIGENRSSWRDFVYNLRRLRYRGGEVNGYPSRLHYISDWAVDNIHRGNFRDVTRDFPRFNELTRTIDFMSENRSKYPALADSANYARIRSIENGYRMHLFPYIKSIDLGNKAVKAAFHNGDVVALVTNIKNLDVSHMGIIVKDSPTAEPYLLHASSSHGKVEVSSTPLAEFMKKNRRWLGLRVFRLAE